jgi:hypothetical protein
VYQEMNECLDRDTCYVTIRHQPRGPFCTPIRGPVPAPIDSSDARRGTRAASSAPGRFAAAVSACAGTVTDTIDNEDRRRATGRRRVCRAGVELVEPENRRIVSLGEGLGWQTIKRLRDATGFRVRRRPMLKACGCSTVFVGDRTALTCPDCARRAAIAQVQRLRAKRKGTSQEPSDSRGINRRKPRDHQNAGRPVGPPVALPSIASARKSPAGRPRGDEALSPGEDADRKRWRSSLARLV